MADQHKTIQLPTLALNASTRKGIFIIAAVICLFPFISPALALLAGIIMAQFIEHPFAQLNHKATGILLKASVIGLGFGMNMYSAVKAGSNGFVFTVASVATVLLVGALVGRWLGIDKKTSFLISAGTAICGGSAIAAISPVIKAQDKQTSVAMGTIFILNAAALFIFPVAGRYLHLSQTQFGLWCAIAIHDTSSVTGAAAHYGALALQVATTVKLARALWIIPVTFITSLIFKSERKISVPWFIILFVLAMLINTFVPIKPLNTYLVTLAKQGLTLTLFLIGSGLSFNVMKSVGVKPMLQGIMLWALISIGSLWVIMAATH